MNQKTVFAAPSNFYLHMLRNASVGCLLICFALLVGMVGYHVFEGMKWVDAFLNASMILSGMGPADKLVSANGKIFAGCYALFSGLAFISIMVIMLSPIIHAFFKKIHVDFDKDD